MLPGSVVLLALGVNYVALGSRVFLNDVASDV